MEFNHEEYSDSKPVPTARDGDDNLLSVSSSDVSYKDESHFVEMDSKNYNYSVNADVIDFEFKEFIVAEKTTANKIEDLFNLYEEVKQSVPTLGNESSHLYLFNSSVDFIGRENLIPVDRNQYSTALTRNKTLTDQLRVCNETKEAENLARDKKLTALYTTVNSVKNGAVNVIDNTLLPVIGDNLQLKYAINSLKSIIAQPIGYLVDNKSELTVERRDVKAGRYDITYNYLANPNYFDQIFQDLLNNPDLSYYQAQIATKDARISELETLLAEALEGGGEGEDEGEGGGEGIGEGEGNGEGEDEGGSGGGDTTGVKESYNRLWDEMYVVIVDQMKTELEGWRYTKPDQARYNSANKLLDEATGYINKAIEPNEKSPNNSQFKGLLSLSKSYVSRMKGALPSVWSNKNIPGTHYFDSLLVVIEINHEGDSSFEKQLETIGRLP